MLKEISQFIVNGTSFVLGTSLLYGFRPENSIDQIVVVADRVGGIPSQETDLKDRVDANIQVTSRAKSYNDALDDITEIYNFLHGSVGFDLPVIDGGQAYYAMVITAIQYPNWLGIDDKKRHEFTCNFVFKIRNK